jgi:2-polyprenyl-3-methyl-5-hydroxy-6-metoxy-1,4-benzoquinol methylase
MDPPGTWCLNEALFEMLCGIEGRRFLEVGCGAGDVSLKLLERGYEGIGLDFSSLAIEAASQKLKPYIASGKYKLIQADLLDKPTLGKDFDIVIGLLIMEHVQDDAGFLETLKSHLRPGGHIIITVPGRRDRWSLEDDTVGHLRRYERKDLF